MPKANSLPTKLGGSKKIWLLNKIKLHGRKENNYSIERHCELTPFQYYSQEYLRSLPNQLLDQQSHFVEYVFCEFLHLGISQLGWADLLIWYLFLYKTICFVQKKVPDEQISPT